MQSPICQRLWLMHPALGAGWRDYLVLRIGPKWVRVIEIGTMTSATVARKDYDSAARYQQPAFYQPARLARRLRRNAKTFGSNAEIKLAIDTLASSPKELPL